MRELFIEVEIPLEKARDVEPELVLDVDWFSLELLPFELLFEVVLVWDLEVPTLEDTLWVCDPDVPFDWLVPIEVEILFDEEIVFTNDRPLLDDFAFERLFELTLDLPVLTDSDEDALIEEEVPVELLRETLDDWELETPRFIDEEIE